MEPENREPTLESVTSSGAPVRRRLATPAAVAAVLRKLKTADEDDSKRRALIQGMLDGNPPYNQKDLDDAGLGTITNVNFMALASNLNARVSASHELFAEVPTLVEVNPAVPDPDDTEAQQRCGVIQEEFSTMLELWPGLLPMVDLVVRETDAYGVGPVLFRDEWDWRPTAIKRGKLLVEPRAKVVVDDNDLLMIRDEMTAGELLQQIDDVEAARLAGWKVSAVRDVLVEFFYKGQDGGDKDDKFQRSTWESLQQALRNNDPDVQAREFETLKVVHALTKEVSGKRGVTHVIQTERDTDPVFLFEKPERFETMSQAVWWMPSNYGDGYLKSIRGIASLMVKADDLSNRYLGRIFDTGWLSSGMVLQPKSQLDLSRLQFVQHGPWTILPPELTAIQTSFAPQIEQLVRLRELSEAVMKSNTGTYRQYNEGVDRTDASRKTARQVIEETSKEARFEKAAVAFRYNQYDQLYREIWRRALQSDYVDGEVKYPGKDMVLEFLKRCEARGVKRKYIVGKAKDYLITATRAVGLGSLGMKYDLTNQVLGTRGMLDAVGQANALRDWLGARVGYRNVGRYAKPVSRDMAPTNELSHAVLENNDLTQGQGVQVGTDQLQKVHIGAHLQGVLVPLIQGEMRQQVVDPQKAMAALQVAIPHVQQHVEILAQDTEHKAFVDQVMEILAQAEAALARLQRQVQKMQQQAQQQQAQQAQQVEQAQQVLKDRELEAKIHEINTKAQIEAMKQQSLNDMRRQKTGEQMQIARTKAAADIERQDEAVAAEIRRSDAAAAAERQRSQAPAAQVPQR